MKKFTATTLAVLGLLGSASAFSQTITNGSFEDPVVPTGQQGLTFLGGQTIGGGWSVLAAPTEDVHLINASAAFPFAGLTQNLLARDGNQWLDLSGENWGGFGRGVAQTFTATAGDQLKLNFSVGNLVNGGNSYVELRVNGNVVNTYGSTGAAPGSPEWTQVWADHSVTFTAAASNLIEFVGVNGPGTTPITNPYDGKPYFADHWSIGLDNVSVQTLSPVPEPSAYAMMVVGMAVVGSIARRRRRAS